MIGFIKEYTILILLAVLFFIAIFFLSLKSDKLAVGKCYAVEDSLDEASLLVRILKYENDMYLFMIRGDKVAFKMSAESVEKYHLSEINCEYLK